MVHSSGDSSSFTEINLTELQRKKAPKRLVYFSDGILEEYSTDEDEVDDSAKDTQPLIDPKTLPWIPYFGYMFWWMGSQALAVCDFLGENLAWFLGITSPKFQYEIDQCEKIMKEEEELQKHIKAENAGWNTNDETTETSPNAIAMQPLAKSSVKEPVSLEVETPIQV
ncbi:Protein FAM177A1 like protein [Argiope bruennichi]|uniref:Protein FAM177A1 like protein n=1 Tax=Argiope bruennichi TaxID=94029 RepID=A0A8T0FRL2_ARGBR|nr:Protein FAM177A1 like protein [Argiope bruennichi]